MSNIILYLSDIDIEMAIYFSGSWHSSRQVAIKIQKREAVTTSAFLDERKNKLPFLYQCQTSRICFFLL
jgi:hypothetical protein